jgi:hypothetical protein
MKRNKILALIGAGVLTMGVVGVAFADTVSHQDGDTLGDHIGTADDCDKADLAEGEVLLHFVLTQTEDSDGNLAVDLSNPDLNPTADHVTKAAGGTLQWDIIVTGVTADTVFEGATTDADGDNLNLSHVCGLGTSTSSSTTSFESSEESTTDSQSSSSTTSFSDSVSDTTSQPPTDTIGNTGSGQQSSGLWMLLAALGVLAGSVIVLAPSKAKSKD